MSAMTARTTQAEPSILWIIHKYLLRFTSCSYIWWNLKCKGINIYFLWSVELHHDLSTMTIAFSLSLFTRITYGSKLVEREQRGSEAQRPLDYVSVMTIADIHWVCSFTSISHRENQRWYRSDLFFHTARIWLNSSQGNFTANQTIESMF